MKATAPAKFVFHESGMFSAFEAKSFSLEMDFTPENIIRLPKARILMKREKEFFRACLVVQSRMKFMFCQEVLFLRL